MLRRLKIGGRVNLLIAVPLLALIAVATLGYVALQRASVRGDDYQALKSAQELRAQTLPPPATLLQAWAEVNAIGVVATGDGFGADAKGQIDRHLRTIERVRREFTDSMTFWAAQPLDADVRASFVDDGTAAADSFFGAIDDRLVPAIDRGDADEVVSVIRSMEPFYETQKVAASTALAWSETAVVAGEQRTDDFVAQVMLFGASGAALLVLTTLLLSVRVRRSIVRPIRALAGQAKAVAHHDLHAAVAAVDDLPADAPTPHLPPFGVTTHDELADLATSFSAVQDVAVDLAVDQARTRRVVSENIVNIARRNQALLGRTLGFITTLEQNERDPDVLDNLFRIDHLTTRMRRNAQSLLVLAGAEPTRLWAHPVQLGDVVRAALSEVENYGQVEIGDVGSVYVQGALAPEVSHLMAELLENATSFSPPTTIVTVVGRAVPDGHQLAIFDHGLGMTEEDLAGANERLNAVSSLDRDSNKMLGFQVIAKLAQRHDIKVMLTTTPGGTGVTAIVRLPKSMMDQPGAVQPDTALAEVGESAALLTAPLPIVTPMTVAPVTFTSMESHISTGEVVAIDVRPIIVPSVSTSASASAEGLTKRVRGAQLPDVGVAQLDAPPARTADEVRDSLSSLQRGTDLGRRQGGE